MIHIPVVQGGSAWLLERYGIPTASNAHKIITAKTAKPSEQQDGYISELIAERYAKKECGDEVEAIDRMLNRIKTESMVYGNTMEPHAASAYELLAGVDLEEVGFMLNDNRTAGASLDRIVKGQKKAVEFKCPFSLSVHVGYCLSRNIEQDKKPQLQWQLWISELDSTDIFAYYPGVQGVSVTVGRDEEYIKKIAEYHAVFWERLEKRWEEFQAMQSMK
jgi:hypothetical protein